MRKLEYSVQQYRGDNGFIYHSHQTLVWEDNSDKNHARHAMLMRNEKSGLSGNHYEDRFPHKDRFYRYTK